MVMGYWSVAILFWQLSIDHIVSVIHKRWGLAETRLRHPSLPFDSLPYPTRTICRRVRTYVRTLIVFSLNVRQSLAWRPSLLPAAMTIVVILASSRSFFASGLASSHILSLPGAFGSEGSQWEYITILFRLSFLPRMAIKLVVISRNLVGCCCNFQNCRSLGNAESFDY